jgi:hypothetical protein
MAACVAMGETGRFNLLRLRYRAHWDAHRAIAQANATLLFEGKQPSDEQLAAEREAAEALKQANDELLAAISCLGQ